MILEYDTTITDKMSVHQIVLVKMEQHVLLIQKHYSVLLKLNLYITQEVWFSVVLKTDIGEEIMDLAEVFHQIHS